MNDSKLTAMPRNEKGYKVRRGGFAPAVLYGRNMEAKSVQFDKNELNTIIRKYGDRARIKIDFEGNESLGIFKEVSRDVLTREIFHLDIQLVDLREELTLIVPIIIHGADAVTQRKLVLQQNLAEVQLTGRVDLIPNKLEIDVSTMEDGDTKVLGDLEVPEGITFSEEPDTLILTTKAPKMVEEEGEEEAEVAEEAATPVDEEEKEE
jgi:large subunit ribosomal protein L25